MLFQGIGKAKIDPIHIYTKNGREPVAQKQRLVARHYLEPLKQHLQELLEGDVIEGRLPKVDFVPGSRLLCGKCACQNAKLQSFSWLLKDNLHNQACIIDVSDSL